MHLGEKWSLPPPTEAKKACFPSSPAGKAPADGADSANQTDLPWTLNWARVMPRSGGSGALILATVAAVFWVVATAESVLRAAVSSPWWWALCRRLHCHLVWPQSLPVPAHFQKLVHQCSQKFCDCPHILPLNYFLLISALSVPVACN